MEVVKSAAGQENKLSMNFEKEEVKMSLTDGIFLYKEYPKGYKTIRVNKGTITNLLDVGARTKYHICFYGIRIIIRKRNLKYH